jgi:hypothetical protein
MRRSAPPSQDRFAAGLAEIRRMLVGMMQKLSPAA